MLRLNRIAQATMVLCVGSAAMVAGAQTTQPTELKKVEVTGSRIKRVDAETSSPVQVITREQIERSGATSVTEVLKNVPASNAGAFDESAVASFTPGAGGISLRGLGAQATLVLINGRRVAPFGFASGGQSTFVDINSIPVEAVERIETLLDGAAAIYGSDAIAGVVNIIMRKDFKGFTASGAMGQSAYKDGDNANASLTYGMGSLAADGYNLLVNYAHNESKAIKASSRPNTATADFTRFGLLDQRSSYGYPGNMYSSSGLSGGTFRGAMPGCTPLADGSALNGRCIYDATQYTDVAPKTSRDSLFFSGAMSLGGGNELFGDASFMQTKFLQASPSYSTSTYYSTGTLPTATLILPVGHPQNTFTSDTMVRYRFMDVDHNTDVVSDTQRMVLGVRGTWFGWDAESAVMYSKSDTSVKTTGLLRDSVLWDEVLDANGKVKPTFYLGNPSKNDAGLMARLYPTLRDQGTTETSSIDIRGTRDLMAIGGGMMAVAVGAETRSEKFTSTPDALTQAGEISVLGASSAAGSRTISAAYAELNAPITKSLETTFAARVDNYSDFGSAVTPKASLKWKALSNLAFRTTYSEGFRAPALTETSSSPTTGFYSGIRDPKLCPVPDNNNTNCSLSVKAVSGSNPALQPERSKSLTWGLVFEPTDSFSMSFDTYNITRRDEISGIDPDYLLANESIYPGYVVRNADGTIKQLNLQYTNLGSTHVMGVDVNVRARFNLGEMGRLTAEGYYNSEPSYKVANVAGAPEVEYAGTWTQPTRRGKIGFTWDVGPWKSAVTWNMTGDYLRAFTPADLSCSYSATKPDLCKVAAWTTADLFLGYTGFKNLELRATIKNVANEMAPIDERRASRYTLYGSTFHSAVGRFISLGAKYTFW